MKPHRAEKRPDAAVMRLLGSVFYFILVGCRPFYWSMTFFGKPVPTRYPSAVQAFFRIMLSPAWPKISEPIKDLVGPEPLEPVQRLVQGRELLVRDAADLLNGLDVLLIERIDDLADFLALRGQADADRTAIDARTLMIEEAKLDELLEVVGDVGAEVIAARAQLARGQLLVANIIEQQRLHRIDVGAAAAVEFVLDDVEQAAMQP